MARKKKNPPVDPTEVKAETSPSPDSKEGQAKRFDLQNFSDSDLAIHQRFYNIFIKDVPVISREICSPEDVKRPEIGYLVAASIMRVAADIFLNLGLDFNTFANLSDNMYVYEQGLPSPTQPGKCNCPACTAAKAIVDDAYSGVNGDLSKLTQEDVAKIIQKIKDKAIQLLGKSSDVKDDASTAAEELKINTKIPKNTLN